MLLTCGVFANRNELAKHHLGGLRLYELEAIQLPVSHQAQNAGVCYWTFWHKGIWSKVICAGIF